MSLFAVPTISPSHIGESQTGSHCQASDDEGSGFESEGDSFSEQSEQWDLCSLAQSAMSKLQHSRAPQSDVTFLVGPDKQEVKAHRLIIAAHSRVMNTMFYAPDEATTGNWKESEDGQVSLPNCDPEVFTNFVNYTYSGQFSISTSSVCNSIELLDFLGADQTLIYKCSEWAERHIDVNTVCEYLVFAKRLRHCVDSLYTACMEWIEDNAIDAMENGVFNEVPLEELVNLAQSKRLCADEMRLFEALRDRQNATGETDLSDTPFEHVQLALMSLEQISGNVKESGVYELLKLSELTFARLQGEFSCDSEKLRSPRNLPWKWQVSTTEFADTPTNALFAQTPGSLPQHLTEDSSRGYIVEKSSPNWVHIKYEVNRANTVAFRAVSHVNHLHCNKNGYRVAVFNTTPALRMTMTFKAPAPVQVLTSAQPGFKLSEYSSAKRQPTNTRAVATAFPKTIKELYPASIDVSNQCISVRGLPVGNRAQFTCSVTRNFLIDLYQDTSNDSDRLVHIVINGFRSTEVVTPGKMDITWEINACDPGLKLCLLPKWN